LSEEKGKTLGIIVNSHNTNSRRRSLDRKAVSSAIRFAGFAGLSLLFCVFPAVAQSPAQQSAPAPSAAGPLPDAPAANLPLPDPQSPGSISGTVVDPSGAAVAGAHVVLTRDDKSPKQEVISGDDGQFSFASIAPGPFQITVTSELFTTQKTSGILHSGESLVLPQIVFALATEMTQVQVTVPRVEADIGGTIRMASVEERVKQIIVEQFGVDEGEVTPTASFVDDSGRRLARYRRAGDGFRGILRH
jgi:hypothetical protein